VSHRNVPLSLGFSVWISYLAEKRLRLFRVTVSKRSLVGHHLPSRRCRLAVRLRLLAQPGPAYNQDIIPGAQNEREGDARPVRQCLAAEASPAALFSTMKDQG